MKKIIICTFLMLSGCVSLQKTSAPEASFIPAKNDINDYTYLETKTEKYNGLKAEQERIVQLQKESLALRMTAAEEITYSKSEEEKIEKLAQQYVQSQQWKLALNILIKYEPILTHNKNLTNLLIFVALKLEYYDFAIDQLLVALQQKYDPKSEQTDYFDKQVILAHTYYLANKYKQAEGLYSELYKSGKYPEAARHLFLLGYKQKDLNAMNEYLSLISQNDPEFIHFNILLAQVEQQSSQPEAAANRIEQLFIDQSNYTNKMDLTLFYAHTLIQNNELNEALKVLDAPLSQLSDQRPYHFMKAYIYFRQGHKEKFQRHLGLTQVHEKYRNDLASLFLEKANYAGVYEKVFQQDMVEDQKLSSVVKLSTEEYTYKYINKPQFRDAVLVREEFRPVTEPLRLPASLEIDPSK